jgi:hypothetical protein
VLTLNVVISQATNVVLPVSVFWRIMSVLGYRGAMHLTLQDEVQKEVMCFDCEIFSEAVGVEKLI